jgi:hypothetical protein
LDLGLISRNFDFKVIVPNPSFGTATLKHYKTVNTHPKWSCNTSITKKILPIYAKGGPLPKKHKIFFEIEE